jgi:hypothetical protein
LFEAITIGAADAIEEGLNILGKEVVNWINDDELTKLTSSATNSRPKLKARIAYSYDRFK